MPPMSSMTCLSRAILTRALRGNARVNYPRSAYRVTRVTREGFCAGVTRVLRGFGMLRAQGGRGTGGPPIPPDWASSLDVLVNGK